MGPMTGIDQTIADAPYGRVETLSSLVRRVLARNPSPFTYTGTGTYIVGRGTVAVIDPGPNDAAHIAALVEAVRGETVSHIVITHTHNDHSPAAPGLKAATEAAIAGCAPLTLSAAGPRADASFDASYAPDLVLADGASIAGPGWTLQALHTPGHTSNHLSFGFPEERALFSGDHVMGWSTTVVAPPDGSMTAYMASLAKLLDRDDNIYYPTHGPAVTEPQRFVRGLMTHRRQRETQILTALASAPASIKDMVATMYVGVDPRLHPAAGLSVSAHLIGLHARGRVDCDGDIWRLAA